MRNGLTPLCLLFLISGMLSAAEPAPETNSDFRTFFVTRSLAHEQLLPYLKAARPEIVQVGNYGAMFHGYADNERSVGWPMNLPVSGEAACLEFQRKLNDQVHALGLKAVGHFRVAKAMGDWQEQSGFVDYYNNRWPEKLLGRKPHPDVREVLARTADGTPIQTGRYNTAQLAFCLSSPHARQMFKSMLKVTICNGCDGVMTNFNYRFDCACPHCQDAFKLWLRQHLTDAQLKGELGIDNLDEHVFDPLPAAIPGYPDPETATKLDWLAKRWGAEHFKQKFDEIFIEYGRSLKTDLIVGQWNHLSHVSIGEERAFTPIENWASGEDFLWYSGGAAFVGKNLNLKEGKAGDAWLSCLYTRELSGGKPFVMGKYDRIRLEASMAEGYATGGIGMGRYMRFEDPVGFDVLVQYTNFMHKHRELYDGAKNSADAALVLPRQSVLAHHPESLDAFRSLGQALLEDQVLLDVLADQKISAERLASYPAVILPKALALSDAQLTALRDYAISGGKVFTLGEVGSLDEQGRKSRDTVRFFGAVALQGEDMQQMAAVIASQLRQQGAATIESPWMVRAAAYEQPGRYLLHLVNYNRDEDTPKEIRNTPAAERPIPVENVTVSLPRLAGKKVQSIKLHAPESNEPQKLSFESSDKKLSFTVPQIRVYGLIEIELAK